MFFSFYSKAMFKISTLFFFLVLLVAEFLYSVNLNLFMDTYLAFLICHKLRIIYMICLQF